MSAPCPRLALSKSIQISPLTERSQPASQVCGETKRSCRSARLPCARGSALEWPAGRGPAVSSGWHRVDLRPDGL